MTCKRRSKVAPPPCERANRGWHFVLFDQAANWYSGGRNRQLRMQASRTAQRRRLMVLASWNMCEFREHLIHCRNARFRTRRKKKSTSLTVNRCYACFITSCAAPRRAMLLVERQEAQSVDRRKQRKMGNTLPPSRSGARLRQVAKAY